MTTPFDLDTWVHEARQEPFRFKLSDHVFTLPAAGELDKSVLSSVNIASPSADDIETLLKAGLGDQWGAFDGMPLPIGGIGELFRRWQKHEGAPLGELSASADS